MASPTSRRSGLKLVYNHPVYTSFTVSALAAEWIEIVNAYLHLSTQYLSPPSRRSGLKSFCGAHDTPHGLVSALAAEWIEIKRCGYIFRGDNVSALAAEWIEICLHGGKSICLTRLRPRGGVD